MEGPSHVRVEYSFHLGLRSAEGSFGITVFPLSNIVWAPIWHYQMFNGPIVILTWLNARSHQMMQINKLSRLCKLCDPWYSKWRSLRSRESVSSCLRDYSNRQCCTIVGLKLFMPQLLSRELCYPNLFASLTIRNIKTVAIRNN